MCIVCFEGEPQAKQPRIVESEPLDARVLGDQSVSIARVDDSHSGISGSAEYQACGILHIRESILEYAYFVWADVFAWTSRLWLQNRALVVALRCVRDARMFFSAELVALHAEAASLLNSVRSFDDRFQLAQFMFFAWNSGPPFSGLSFRRERVARLQYCVDCFIEASLWLYEKTTMFEDLISKQVRSSLSDISMWLPCEDMGVRVCAGRDEWRERWRQVGFHVIL